MAVSLISGRLNIDGSLTCEEMRGGLPQPDGLLVQLLGASAGSGHQAVPHGLHSLLAVWVQEDDDRIPLRVVQGVHGLWRHVQQGVSVLRKRQGWDSDSRTSESCQTEILRFFQHFTPSVQLCRNTYDSNDFNKM